MESTSVWSDNHTKLSTFLQKLYPQWSDLLSGINDEAILDEVILLLAYYFDSGAPALFVHPISETGQVQLDCAKIGLGGQAGDIPLVVNVYRKFCDTPKRERHHFCAKNCVDYATVKKLDQAYLDLKCSIEGHIGKRIIRRNQKTLMEKLHHLGEITIAKRPDAVYVHDGRPGLSYINVRSQNRVRLEADSSLSLCPDPPKFILMMPKTSNYCALSCDESLVKSLVVGNKNFELELSRTLSKVCISTKVCDCGRGLQEYLSKDSSRRLVTLTRELWKHCGCEEDDVHIAADPLTHSLILFCPEKLLDKAKSVVEERVKIIRAEWESNFTLIDFPEHNNTAAHITTGGHLVEIDSQPSYERTLALWVYSPENRRKLADEDLSEEYVQDTLLKSVKDVVAVRKFRTFPESAMWGLVTMKDTMASKLAISDFNRPRGKYKLQWINYDAKDSVLMFSVEKKLRNKVWVNFANDYAFETAKRFPWNEYWVVDTYFFDDRQAKFVFKRDREDIYRLRNDISDLAGVGVSSVKHEAICPLRWSEEELKNVEDTLEAKFKEMNYMESYELHFLSRQEGDTQWQGIARFESFHQDTPDRFNRDTGFIALKNDMTFIHNGVRDGLTLKIPRKVYYLLKKEIDEQETTFHGSVGVQVSDLDQEVVSVHFVWWNGGKITKDLEELLVLLRPAVVFGVEHDLGNCLDNDCRPFEAVERWFQVKIVAESESPQILLVYGRPSDRTKAAEHLKITLVEDNKKESIACETIPLSGPSVPSGLITTLINKYGHTLDKLKIMSGCTTTHLDKKQHTILCRGRPSRIQIVKEELDTCCSELVGNTWAGLFTQIKECVACLCPVEDPQNTPYHLEICGHVYCTECLVSQVKTQLAQKILPITCVAEECETKMSVNDILAACSKGEIGTDKFVEVTLQHHLSRNRAICKPCPTPDCPMVYHVPVDDDKRFDCPHCDKEICMDCEEKWHAGFSCEIRKEIDNLQDEKLKTWILTKPDFRKMCPSCKSGVEKMGGCDNVHCASCSTSMCWKCLQYFKSSGDCYDHIAKKHKNEPAVYDYDDDL